MRILALALGLLPITALAASDSPLEILDLKTADRPTIEQAAVQARWLLRRESVGTLSTVFQKGAPDDLEGLPIGLMDYYADCSKDGTPALLGLSIATSFRNVKNGSAISLSVRQHPFIGREFFSPAAHHRVSLIGTLKKVDADSDEAKELTKCFLRRHHDAKWWLPGNKIHESFWVKLKVDKIYWIGGFGNVQQIGWIPLDLYQNVTLPHHPHHHWPGHGKPHHGRPPHGRPPHGKPPGRGGRRHWRPPSFHHGPPQFFHHPPPPPSCYPPPPPPAYYPPYGYPQYYGGYYPPPPPPPPPPQCHGPPPPPHGRPRGPQHPPPHHGKPPHGKPPGDHDEEPPHFGGPPSRDGPNWGDYSDDDEEEYPEYPEYPGSGDEDEDDDGDNDGDNDDDDRDDQPNWPAPGDGHGWNPHWPKPPKRGGPWGRWQLGPDQQQEL